MEGIYWHPAIQAVRVFIWITNLILMSEDSAWKKYANRFKVYPSLVAEEVDPDVYMIFCIPVFAEPQILLTLESLLKADHSNLKAEAILLFNLNEFATEDEIMLHQNSWAIT